MQSVLSLNLTPYPVQITYALTYTFKVINIALVTVYKKEIICWLRLSRDLFLLLQIRTHICPAVSFEVLDLLHPT